MNTKTISTGAVVAIAIAVLAAVFGSRAEKKTEVLAPETRFIAALEPKVNDIAKIRLDDNDSSITLVRIEDQWAIADKNNYPARFEPVRELLIALKDMKKVEAKTSNPDLYDRLEVEDITKPNAKSKQVRLYDEKGTEVADVILGKAKYGAGSVGDSNTFARLTAEKQAWQVTGTVNAQVEVNSWIESTILQLTDSRVESARIKHPDGEIVLGEKAKPGDSEFNLATKPEDRTLTSPTAGNELGRLLSFVRFEDVFPETGKNLTGVQPIETLVRTFDGVTVLAKSYPMNGEWYLTFTADLAKPQIEKENARRTAANDELIKTLPTPTPAPTPKEGEPAPTPAPTPELPKPDLIDEKKMQEEVDELNKKFKGWVFKVDEGTATRFTRRNEFFLAAPTPAPTPAPADATTTETISSTPAVEPITITTETVPAP